MSFPIGSRVYLRACVVGEPGMVLRKEHSRLVVYWADMDFLSRHPEAALILADVVEPVHLSDALARRGPSLSESGKR